MPLPYPSLVFTPFDQLPADSLNEMRANEDALAAGTGIDDEAILDRHLADILRQGWHSMSSAAYASATTITVDAETYAAVSVGSKVWFNQSGDKYFYVTEKSGGNILTLNAGSDYTVANAAITAPYFSNAATPTGFPQWFNFVPAWTNLTIGNATVKYKFTMEGKQVTAYCDVILGNTSSASGGGISSSLPVPASSLYSGAYAIVGTGAIDDVGTATWPINVAINSSTTNIFYVANSSGDVRLVQVTNTKPGTFNTSDLIKFTLTYEAA